MTTGFQTRLKRLNVNLDDKALTLTFGFKPSGERRL
jgi:hypothetical protein